MSCLSERYNSDESYFYVNEIQTWKSKGLDNAPSYLFCLGNISKSFTKGEMREVALSCVYFIQVFNWLWFNCCEKYTPYSWIFESIWVLGGN